MSSLKNNESNNDENKDCRLCQGSLSEKFSLEVLRNHQVKYLVCNSCHSLQTEFPHWLEEAYGSNLSNLDTGAAQRNLQNLAACYAVSKVFNLNNALDFGGGDGFLCRLLRDYGLNCFVMDKYASPTYAQGFTEPNFEKPDLLISFEVLEHFVHPKSEIENLFSFDPKVLLVSTALYTNQAKDWWYLGAESGQHVFFYSKEAIHLIGDKFGYDVIISGGYILFVKEKYLGFFKREWISLLLKGKMLRLIRSFIQLFNPKGVWPDHLTLKERLD